MRHIHILSMPWAAVLLAAGTAHAGVIYDNGGPNQHVGYTADSSYPFTAAADEFTLAVGNNTIVGVNWWGGCSTQTGSTPYTCSPPNAFTLFFLSDSGSGSPGAQITSYSVGNANQTATGNTFGGGAIDEYSYSASIPDLTLTAGTQYWLAISDSSTTPFWDWETAGTPGTGDAYSFCRNAGQCTFGWNSGSDELAFNLDGPATSAVPEPGSLAMFAAGALGLAAIRRRRRRRSLPPL